MTETIDLGPAAPSSSVAPLTRREALRYVRNPVFLAVFLGGLGMMAAFWLTRSMRRSAEALDVTPTTAQARTAALCAVAVVPFGLGWLSLLLFVRIQRLDGIWRYGAFSPSDRMAVLLSQIVVPALGGPLLGIALARWVRS